MHGTKENFMGRKMCRIGTIKLDSQNITVYIRPDMSIREIHADSISTPAFKFGEIAKHTPEFSEPETEIYQSTHSALLRSHSFTPFSQSPCLKSIPCLHRSS